MNLVSWALIWVCALTLAAPVLRRVWRNRLDPFEPIVLFALAYGAMFVARPASALVEDETLFWGVDVMPTLSHALLLATIGAIGFVAGYEVRAGGRLAHRLPTPRAVNTRIAALGAGLVALLGALGLMVFFRGLTLTESFDLLLRGRTTDLGALVNESSSYVWYASLLFAPSALVLIALTYKLRSVVLGVFAAIVLGIALLRIGPVGSRIVLLPLVGGVFVFFYLVRQRRPRSLLLISVGVLALLSSYLTLSLRDPTDDTTLRSAVVELGQRPQAILDPVLRGADAEMVLALSAALTVIPDELSHRWGSATIVNLVVRPVPRELWASKPRPPGEDVVATIWPNLYPGLDPAFSPLLVLYWDFGPVGVVLGMALFGILARALFEWFRLHRDSFVAQLVFAASVWFVVIGARNDPVDTLVFAGLFIAPVVAILTLASSGTTSLRCRGRRVA